MPIDTNELIVIGQEMKICVGTYRDQVLSKRSIVVSMKQDDKYVGCIELGNDFCLRQIKGKRNSYLIGNAGKAAIKWVKKSGIQQYQNHPDYTHIGEVRETSMDYHNLDN